MIRCTSPDTLLCSCDALPVHAVVDVRYVNSSAAFAASYAGACGRPSTVDSNACGPSVRLVMLGIPAAAAARLNRWFAASVAAKLTRASVAPLENHAGPRSHPETSGGSKRFCPMLFSGVSAEFSEKPDQPKSFSPRTTTSAGQAYRRYIASQNSPEVRIARTTSRIDDPFCRY